MRTSHFVFQLNHLNTLKPNPFLQSTHPFNHASERRVVRIPGAPALELALDEATQMGEQVGQSAGRSVVSLGRRGGLQ